MRVVGQPDKICAQLPGPAKQCLRILATVGTSTAKRRFFMNAHAAKEDGPSIQENVNAFRLDAAKADLIIDVIGLGFDGDVVELGIIG